MPFYNRFVMKGLLCKHETVDTFLGRTDSLTFGHNIGLFNKRSSSFYDFIRLLSKKVLFNNKCLNVITEHQCNKNSLGCF